MSPKVFLRLLKGQRVVPYSAVLLVYTSMETDRYACRYVVRYSYSSGEGKKTKTATAVEGVPAHRHIQGQRHIILSQSMNWVLFGVWVTVTSAGRHLFEAMGKKVWTRGKKTLFFGREIFIHHSTNLTKELKTSSPFSSFPFSFLSLN